MDKNITPIKGGLHTDNSRIDTPKGTYQYALNAVDETEKGDNYTVSNEQSNEPCGALPNSYIPINSTYIGDNKTAIFSVSPDGITSEIGIMDEACNYVTHVNSVDLGFKVTHQIDATYRLRRGCEKTVYWVDGKNNKPLYYIFEKPWQFKNDAGDWVKNKFELQRSYSKVPKFQDIELLNSGGQVPPGSVNVAVQYLDENLNPTEWITTSEVVKVYNDDTSENFIDISGSINIQPGVDYEDYRTFPVTDKALKVTLDDLDDTFLFYRLAFIVANTGTGQVSDVLYTENLPVENKIFIFTGINYETKGTEEEIKAFNSIIESAGSIDQIDNMLLLGNTQGKQVDYCRLQSYASAIKADMTTRKVLLNQMVDPANPKSPTSSFEGIGYQPGEIYSFGIVYIFKDGTQTPVYHIPGKSNNIFDSGLNNIAEDFVFKPGDGVYPMALNNKSVNSVYTDNSTCDASDYWGVDSIGDPLKFSRVRHHRFPLRSKVNLPLVTLENTIGGVNEYFQVRLQINGDLVTHFVCTQPDIDNGDCSILDEQIPLPPLQVRVTYTVDGVPETMITNILPSDYIGASLTTTIALVDLSDFNTSSNITIVSIEESLNDGTTAIIGVDTATGDAEHGSLSYSVAVVPATFSTESRVYSSEIFGIQFSNVALPPTAVTKGEEIVGYYIVRNERTETEKTILDSAVLTPSITNEKYIAHGLLFPEFVIGERRIADNVYGIISPEHKFNDYKYSEFTSMSQEGQFEVIKVNKSKSRYLDVLDGTSYDADIHKSGGARDEDGWSLKSITRDNITQYRVKTGDFDFVQDDVEDIFYLDALQSRTIQVAGTDEPQTVYNISGDNKIGIMHLKEDSSATIDGKLPYVYLKREVADSYSTFRTLPYYKTSINMHKFYDAVGNYDPLSDTAVEFNGDSYLTSLRYLNTMWWDNRPALRAGQTSAWAYIAGVVLVVVGAVLSIFYGAGAPLVIAGSLILAGAGAVMLASGIKKDALVRAYYEEYDKGLRETLLDDWVDEEYVKLPCERGQGWGGTYPDYCDTPEDDEIQWLTDCVTDLWFESQVNISLRHGVTSGIPTFLSAPGLVETGNELLEQTYESFGIYKQRDISLYPFTALDKHVMEKLLVFSPERQDSREYIGHPFAEWYQINPDYLRGNKQKVFYHLPIEYDCCSDCQEDFPHRTHYSQQSYQEELTDNFRVFLPNDYRDLEGETGQITDIFTIKNNIYIHTEEALWHQPQNFQERITGDIVSFLGTGGYFTVPPRKIVDDEMTSAGTRHRWATVKSKHGVSFVCEKEDKIYSFDGNSLQPLTDIGMEAWFNENLGLNTVKDYYARSGKGFKYDDNPSNPYGVGFTSAYDTEKQRLLFTKKDKILDDIFVDGGDYEICAEGGNLIMFPDYEQTILDRALDGWVYLGLEDCKMKFEKTTLVPEVQTGATVVTTTIPPDTIIVPMFDTTSMTPETIANISATLDAWFVDFKTTINGGDNTVTLLNPGTWNEIFDENWVYTYPNIVLTNVGPGKNVMLLAFIDEAGPFFHPNFISNPQASPTAEYLTSVYKFRQFVYPNFASFIGITYPIVRNTPTCKEFLKHVIAGIEGRVMTQGEVDALKPNPNFTLAEWEELKLQLLSNTYAGVAEDYVLKHYGWRYREDRADGIDANGTTACPVDGVSVITPCQFTLDMQDALVAETTVTTTAVDITVLVPSAEIEYVEGNIVDLEKADNSWTMSFSLKRKSWTSWHSYIPDFFFTTAKRLMSWKNGKLFAGANTFWKHNKIGSYGNFYNQEYPFSVEYTSLSEPLKTRLWEDIQLHTEAKKWDFVNEEFVDQRFITFNKAIIYNHRQCTGELTLEPKSANDDSADFLLEQVVNNPGLTVTIDENEGDWSINDIRDIRVDYDKTIFDSNIMSLQSDYYTDKILNSSSLDENKPWEQLESFRGKYLVVRLIFDNFDDVKLILNYSVENEAVSIV